MFSLPGWFEHACSRQRLTCVGFVGKYAPTEGAALCLICDAGLYSSADGSTACSSCDQGEFNPLLCPLQLARLFQAAIRPKVLCTVSRIALTVSPVSSLPALDCKSARS